MFFTEEYKTVLDKATHMGNPERAEEVENLSVSGLHDVGSVKTCLDL